MGRVGSLMQVQALLTELKSLGVHLRVENGNLWVKTKPGVLTDLIKAGITEHKAAIISRLEMESPSVDPWQQLAKTSLTDMDVIGLNDAIFLFAYRMIQNADRTKLPGIWKRYSPYWRKRQSRKAYHIVERLYESRSESGHGVSE
jgi:uncharacterized protein YihD (DUF1040 family)